MSKVVRGCLRVIDVISMAGGGIGGVMILVISALTVYEIIARYVFNSPTIWTLETSLYLLIWLSLVSGAYVQRQGRHLHVDLLIGRLPSRTRAIWDIITLTLGTIFISIFVYYTYHFFLDSIIVYTQSGTLLDFPMWVVRLALPVGGIMLGLQYLREIIAKAYALFTQPLEKGNGLSSNLSFLLIAFFALVGLAVWLYQISPIVGLVMLLLVLLFSGVSIFTALGTCGIVGLFFIGGANQIFAMPTIAFGTLNSAVLACLPVFVFVGQILATSGIGEEIFDMGNKWIGRVPGGLGITTILACAIFAAISISSVVTALTIGLVALPSLIAHKYDRRFSLGVVCSGGTLGMMIPPSGIMIVYSMMTGESLGKLFFAGLIPGVILVSLFSLYAFLFCRRTGSYERTEHYTWKQRLDATKTGIWGALTPVIMLVGIYSGICTPLESAALGVAYALPMSLIRGKLKFRQLPRVLADCVTGGTLIMFVIVGALILGNYVTVLGIPAILTNTIVAAEVPGWLVIVALMLFYFVLGMFLDPTGALMITLPVFYPLIISLGFDGIWFAVITCLNMEIAELTPPVGMTLYAIQGISQATFGDIFKGVAPFYFIMIIGLVIAAVFPTLSTYLPNMLMG